MTTVYEKNAIVEEEKFLKYNSIKADNDNVNDTENELLINLLSSIITCCFLLVISHNGLY